MKKELISVVIPAYNAASVLERCVRSVLKQSYPYIEIIIVDDGSKDDTGKIAKKLAVEDQRIRLLQKSNGGVSAARNDALKLVTGKWVTFVDSDDYLSSDFFATLICDNDSDLIVGGYHTVGAHEIPSMKYESCIARTPDEIKELLEKHLTDMTFLCPWGKLFKSSLIRSSQLSFNIEMRVGEDVVFVWEYLAHCESVSLNAIQGYHYFTKEEADYKYALDGQTAIRTISSILEKLTRLRITYQMNTDKSHAHILNYYIWLYKLYIKKNYTFKDLRFVKDFFYHPVVFQYFQQYKYSSKDKLLVYLLLRMHLTPLLYLLIKLYY